MNLDLSIENIIISIITSLLVAHLATRKEFRVERLRKEIDLVLSQRCNYFLPFKYSADEFLRRLVHIESRLSPESKDIIKRQEMVNRFLVNLESREIPWFYDDSNTPPGGYFVTSTMYMNCILFYWMRRIQWEQPYIPLFSRRRQMKLIHKVSFRQKCDVHDFIKELKVIFSGYNGIPYGVHDSIGDSMVDKKTGRVSNYSEFISLMTDRETRQIFLPMIRFWTKLVASDGTVCQEKLEKIRSVITVLRSLQTANVRELY